MEVGTVIHLVGITLKGKNRIDRGGHTWIVRKTNSEIKIEGFANKPMLLVESLKKGHREMFWMQPEGDPNVKRINMR